MQLKSFKAPLKCWEPQIRLEFGGKISFKLSHNVKEDVISDTLLQRFPSKNVLINIDKRIHNLDFLLNAENLKFVFFQQYSDFKHIFVLKIRAEMFFFFF